jgi:hypothetical protein
VLGLLASGSAIACSLVLQDQSLPCTTDADCAKYTGSMCDIVAQHCVAGTSDGGELGDGTTTGARDGSSLGAETSSDAPATSDSPVDDTGTPLDAPAQTDAPSDAGAPLDAATDADADGGDAAATIDWPALTKYLDQLYSSTQELVERAPATGQYYTSPDNALAQRAFLYLPVPDTAKSATILTRLMSYKICGCSAHPGHDATINHQFDPLVTKGATIPANPAGDITGMPMDTRSPGGTCSGADAAIAPVCPPVGIYHEDRPPESDAGQQWSADTCNATTMSGYSLPQWDTPGMSEGYADLIALELLSYRNQGLDTTTLWSLLSQKWDGTGMVDSANASDGFYSTYKLALFKLTARAINQTLPSGVDAVLIASQGANGGIRTSYTTSTSFTDQIGNAETTSLVTLAFLMPTSDF